MNKRSLYRIWSWLRHIKPWYFLIVAIVSAVVCVFSLRANNEHMVVLRDAVYSADINNTDVQTALGQLQAYVTSHMNTNLSTGNNPVYPPIQLKYTYNRSLQAQTKQLVNSNSGLALIPDSLFKFDFISPTWSPDMAGWSLLGAILAFVMFSLKLITDAWFKRHLS